MLCTKDIPFLLVNGQEYFQTKVVIQSGSISGNMFQKMDQLDYFLGCLEGV